MIDASLFDDMMKMLATQYQYWKPLDEFSRKAMLSRLNKFDANDQEFGDYCLNVMGHKGLERADIVDYFKQKYLEKSRLKALPEPRMRADLGSDEFIRFQRFYRQLRSALAQGKAYPADKRDFHALWTEPLETGDREYAEARRRHIEESGFSLPLGGGHDLN